MKEMFDLEITELTGARIESAHLLPQFFGKTVDEYDGRHALTVLLTRDTHVELDQSWMREFRIMRWEGRDTATAGELYDVIGRAIDSTESISQEHRNSMKHRLSDEMFVDFGLKPDTVLPIPFAHLKPRG